MKTSTGCAAQARRAEEKPMSEPFDHEHLMRLAIEEARRGGAAGNIAVGSVIVRAGAVIGTGHNTSRSGGDPIDHAEIVAIRDACRREGTHDLAGATLYTAMEPCPMCAWAICMTGIGRVVLGARHATFHRPEMGDYAIERLIEMTGANVEVITGVLEAECEGLRPELERRA
jgi:tRNA(Arg) A34 adenosine deaminase TadA